MNRAITVLIVRTTAALAILAMPVPALAQVAGADQGIFNDEQQMEVFNQQQVGNYQRQKMQLEQEMNNDEMRSQPYRLYAQKMVTQLSKPGAKKSADDQTRLNVYEDWLKKDAALKSEQMGRLKQLDRLIANTQQTQQTTIANLNSDINSMRENVQDQKDAQKFNQMMQINYFNELQSEMGAASWGRPPEDGTFNSVGGYGMLGGYGYGAMGRSFGPRY
jgi:hypothetical protein